MKNYIGYIRVSTPKQGEGVSLREQREAIERYAERNSLFINIWFEEMETAAKHGRPVFNEALQLLRHDKAQGIILHKLDRGARNLRDWTAIGELADAGTEVHFVNESLDLQSRGGRLSADIQAVVSADYIRNLREETRKGFYGRLKQGLYPLPAPLGYLNHGKGNPKTIDPIKGPLVKLAFELYSTAQYSFDTLGDELYRRGLRNRHGRRISPTGMSTILNNTFYFGFISINATGESFIGIHKPLISKSVFGRVQDILTGKTNTRSKRHAFLFRRMIACQTCHYSLVGELQKGHVYYRCHGKRCPRTSVREDLLESKISEFLQQIRFSEREMTCFKSAALQLKQDWMTQRENEARSLKLQLDQIKDRLTRLTDALLDQVLDKAAFNDRRESLLLNQKGIEENLASLLRDKGHSPDKMEKFLELAESAWLSYQSAFPEEKREMLKIVTSNLIVNGKELVIEPSFPFQFLTNGEKNSDCGPYRGIPRTLDQVMESLAQLTLAGKLPDLKVVEDIQQRVEAADGNNTISLTE